MNSQSNRVAIFSLAYLPFAGGAELAVKEITDRLKRRRFICFTYKFDKDWLGEEAAGNVKVLRLPQAKSQKSLPSQQAGKVKNTNQKEKKYYGHYLGKFLYIFRAWRMAEKFHKQEKFSAIWAVMASYGGLAALSFKLRHPDVPLLLTLQEGDSEKHILKRVGIFYPFWRLIFRKADYIQAISNYLADFARRYGARCPIEVVPNGVNLVLFSDTNKSRMHANDVNRFSHNSHGLALSSRRLFTIITTSRLVYKNGIDVLIRAIAELKNFRLPTSDFRLLILGDGPEREQLENLAKELGLDEQVKFFGQVPIEEIPGYLSQAHVFVRLSRSEGLGNSFLEAMAAGLPVVGTAVGGIKDFLVSGETGLIAETENPKDAALKIKQLFENGALREKIIRNASALVQEKFSWEKIAGLFGDIFTNKLIVKPSLLIATGLFPPAVGGPATYSWILSTELQKRNFRVSVLDFGAVRELPKFLRHAAYFLKLLSQGRRAKIIFAQDPVSVGLPAALATKMTGKRFFLKMVGDYAWEQGVQRFGVTDLLDDFLKKKYGWRTEFLRRIQKFTAGQAEKIIVPSQYLKSVVSAWGIRQEKILVIPNACEPAEIQGENSKATSSQDQLIFSAGRLVSWKGFTGLIAAMPAILRVFPKARLVIAGDGPEKENLKSQISNLKLNNQVQLIGSLDRQKLIEYLRVADVFALNTAYEGFSHQLLEALALGAPIVTTKAGGNPELLRHGENGLLINFGDQAELESAVHSLLSSAAMRNKFRKAGPITAANFTVRRMVEETVKTLL